MRYSDIETDVGSLSIVSNILVSHHFYEDKKPQSSISSSSFACQNIIHTQHKLEI